MKDYSKLLQGSIRVVENIHLRDVLTIKENEMLRYLNSQPNKFSFQEFKDFVRKTIYSDGEVMNDSELLEGIRTLEEKCYLKYVEGNGESFIELI